MDVGAWILSWEAEGLGKLSVQGRCPTSVMEESCRCKPAQVGVTLDWTRSSFEDVAQRLMKAEDLLQEKCDS